MPWYFMQVEQKANVVQKTARTSSIKKYITLKFKIYENAVFWNHSLIKVCIKFYINNVHQCDATI